MILVHVHVMLVHAAQQRHREVNLVRLLHADMPRAMLHLPQGSDAQAIVSAALQAVEAAVPTSMATSETVPAPSPSPSPSANPPQPT